VPRAFQPALYDVRAMTEHIQANRTSVTGAVRSIHIIGGGAFGLSAACELRARGWRVDLLDAAAHIPAPAGASTDISKIVRMDYGPDEIYTELAEQALAGWDGWNASGPAAPLYHEDGFLLLARRPFQPGDFEYESFEVLRRRGHRVERLEPSLTATRFPAWSTREYPDGYFNPRAGWAESGRAVAWMLSRARAAGVRIHEGMRVERLAERGSRVTGAVAVDGSAFQADAILVAAGAWTPSFLPHLNHVMRATAQPVVHFRIADAGSWQAPRFPVWAADIAGTGWYGFPALPDGTLKIGHHGPGRSVDPDEPREVLPSEVQRFRDFFDAHFPALAGSPVSSTRLCLYCDTFDGDFWIGADPDRPGLVVAAGDSGHGFKFAPVLGRVIADTVEGRANRWSATFGWRSRTRDSKEAARALGPPI
jgi:glycine/D-amino acid oxidase-like deaminating enzyme